MKYTCQPTENSLDELVIPKNPYFDPSHGSVASFSCIRTAQICIPSNKRLTCKVKEQSIKETNILIVHAAVETNIDTVSQYKSLCSKLQLLPHSSFHFQYTPLQISCTWTGLSGQCCSAGHRLLYWETHHSSLTPQQHAQLRSWSP